MNSANVVPDVPYRGNHGAGHGLYLARARHRAAREWAAHPERSAEMEAER
jgi:hypothetical protein